MTPVTREQFIKACDTVAQQIEMGFRPGYGRMFRLFDPADGSYWNPHEILNHAVGPSDDYIRGPYCALGHVAFVLGWDPRDVEFPLGWQRISDANDAGDWDLCAVNLRTYGRTAPLPTEE